MEALRSEAESFIRESRREWYLAGAGHKEAVRLGEIYARHPDLFRRERLEEVTSALAAAPRGSESRWRLRELRGFLVTGFIGEALKDLTEGATNFEIAASVPGPGGERLSYRQSAVVLLNERDRLRREALEAARMEVVRRKNEFLVPLHRRTHLLAAELGFRGYMDMMSALKSYPLVPVREEMGRFLGRTGELYLREMDRALREAIGVPLLEARRHDALHLFRGERFDHFFPPDRLLDAARFLCASLGMDLEAGERIRLDVEPRPRKSPRAFCAPVRVPEEVYLVICPRGGQDDCHAFLHELGHALHHVHADPAASFEARRMGDNSVTEAYAMLFDHLLLDPAWLVDALGGSEENWRDFLRSHGLHELFMLRRYAAKIDYETALHQGADVEKAPALYSGKLGGATGVSYPPESYLDDVDRFFYCANYLRAWMLQAQLAEGLRSRFGRRWWREKGAGDFLRGLWRSGQAEDGDALSRRIDFGRLTAEPLAEQVERLLAA